MTVREYIDRIYEQQLRRQCKKIPNHIALIQDGNRRFAKEHGIDTAVGHRLGADTTEKMLDWAHDLGVRHITLYTFSTENFKRNNEELKALFALFREKFLAVTKDKRVHAYKIRVQTVGDRTLLPDDLLRCIEEAETATASYNDFFLNIALAYGGRNEIVQATRSILSDVKAGSIGVDDVQIPLIEQHLNDGLNLPPVDLIIRTGDDKRTSNFLPWLANGNESAVYFCAPYWPDFRKIDLLRAIRLYDQRI